MDLAIYLFILAFFAALSAYCLPLLLIIFLTASGAGFWARRSGMDRAGAASFAFKVSLGFSGTLLIVLMTVLLVLAC